MVTLVDRFEIGRVSTATPPTRSSPDQRVAPALRVSTRECVSDLRRRVRRDCEGLGDTTRLHHTHWHAVQKNKTFLSKLKRSLVFLEPAEPRQYPQQSAEAVTVFVKLLWSERSFP